MDSHEVNKMGIRANWLLSSSKTDYEAILKQAFIFLSAERDYVLSVKSKFPENMQIQLKENLDHLKSSEFKEELKKDLKKKARKTNRIATFNKNVSPVVITHFDMRSWRRANTPITLTV